LATAMTLVFMKEMGLGASGKEGQGKNNRQCDAPP